MPSAPSVVPPGRTRKVDPTRFFNTTGPIKPDRHYHIPPLDRLKLAELRRLVAEERYFVLHAPRQTGKTSALLAFQDLLNAEGDYRCVYVNVEGAQAAREDVARAIRVVLGQTARRARLAGDDFLAGAWSRIWAEHGDGALGEALADWAEAASKPLVLLIDEIDALVGDSLLSVLRQLRAGYDMRPEGFPQSVVLCGVRDVRDYRIHSSSAGTMVAGGSAFNVKAASLRLGDFCRDEVLALLGQHTEETGQAFADDALDAMWTQTRGQPWLVNALAYETCFRGVGGAGGSRAVTETDVLEAREVLIARRETHLDQLADKLQEERVRRVVAPLLAGGGETEFSGRDLEYARDLGLVARDLPLRIANPVYAEVVPRELTWTAQESMVQDPAWYVDASGGLELDKLLGAFQEFFREHSEHWVERFQYKEAGPQLLLQAFLQRVVNSGGRIEREYGLGRGRTDLLVLWPEGGGVGMDAATSGADRPAEPGRPARKFVVECKVVHKGLERTMAEGVEQTAGYMDRCGVAEGHLVVFDRRDGRSWDEKVFRLDRTATSGAEVVVWGM